MILLIITNQQTGETMQEFYDRFYDEHTCVFTTQHNSFPALPSGGTKAVLGKRPWIIIIPFRDILLEKSLAAISSQSEDSVKWEAFWRASLLLEFIQGKFFKFNYLKKQKYADLNKLIKKFLAINPASHLHASENITLSHVAFLCKPSYLDDEMRLIIKDAIAVINQLLEDNQYILYFQITTGLYGDTEPISDLQKQILTGLFHLEQSCKAAGLNRIRFKIFLSQKQWDSLIFDNKSHYTGRDWKI